MGATLETTLQANNKEIMIPLAMVSQRTAQCETDINTNQLRVEDLARALAAIRCDLDVVSGSSTGAASCTASPTVSGAIAAVGTPSPSLDDAPAVGSLLSRYRSSSERRTIFKCMNE